MQCPRCGAQLRSTVSLTYFKAVLIVAILLLLVLASTVSGFDLLLPIILGFSLFLFYRFLPRYVNLQRAPADLELVDEGNERELQLEKPPGKKEGLPLVTVLIAVILLILLIAGIRYVSASAASVLPHTKVSVFTNQGPK